MHKQDTTSAGPGVGPYTPAGTTAMHLSHQHVGKQVRGQSVRMRGAYFGSVMVAILR